MHSPDPVTASSQSPAETSPLTSLTTYHPSHNRPTSPTANRPFKPAPEALSIFTPWLPPTPSKSWLDFDPKTKSKSLPKAPKSLTSAARTAALSPTAASSPSIAFSPPIHLSKNVFDYSIRSTVDDVLAGYNGTVFAYGQTGSGKTYTMMGADIGDGSSKGIIPRIVEQIFDSIMRSDGSIEFTVKVSYMEIYMEKIRDLLVPQNDNLPIHEDKQRGVYVKGLHEFYVGSVGEVYQVLERGGQSRTVAATNMNQESSRSHSIFVIEVTQKNVETGSARSGRLFLVDLAGSEKIEKTGATGQTLEEAKKINKSLSALGMVINALSDGKSSHIPYRDSKLTRILQESLGGNSRTTLIINCSPSGYNEAETISTLRFGERAKTIKQKAKVNEELSPAQLKTLLKKAQGQVTTFESYIQSLENEISTWRKGDQVPKEHWTPALKDVSRTPMAAPARPATPSSRLQQGGVPGTPRPESRFEMERAGTPSLVLERDEREEFLATGERVTRPVG